MCQLGPRFAKLGPAEILKFCSELGSELKKNEKDWLSLNLSEDYFTRDSIFWLSDAFSDGGEAKGAS